MNGNFGDDVTWTPERPVAGDVAPVDPNAALFASLHQQFGLPPRDGPIRNRARMRPHAQVL